MIELIRTDTVCVTHCQIRPISRFVSGAFRACSRCKRSPIELIRSDYRCDLLAGASAASASDGLR